MKNSRNSAGAGNFLPSVNLTQELFDGITAHVLAAIPTELSRLLGCCCATQALIYGDNIQRMIVVTVEENSSVMSRGSMVNSVTAVGCMNKE
jgi:exosortase/archaeosortase